MGKLHSLTLMRATPLGSRLIISSAHAFSQPQSQTIREGQMSCLSRCRDFGTGETPVPLCIPSKNKLFTSAMTSPGERLPHRGQLAPLLCDQQLVRFSEAVMVKQPPRSGTARQMKASES